MKLREKLCRKCREVMRNYDREIRKKNALDRIASLKPSGMKLEEFERISLLKFEDFEDPD